MKNKASHRRALARALMYERCPTCRKSYGLVSIARMADNQRGWVCQNCGDSGHLVATFKVISAAGGSRTTAQITLQRW